MSHPLWVNVASSFYTLEGYTNLDTSIYYRMLQLPQWVQDKLPQKYQKDVQVYRDAKAKAPVKFHDCRKPLPFKDNSIEHIVCSHFLEHVYPDECAKILADYYDKLHSGGTVHIVVPDLNEYIEAYTQNRSTNPDQAADDFMTYSILSRSSRGSWKYRFMEATGLFGLQHRWMYDQASMEKMVAAAGFKLVKRTATPSKDYRHKDGSVHVFGQKG